MSFPSEIQDPRFHPRADAPGHIPLGQYPIPAGSRLRAVKCVHCERPLGLSSWDYYAGFLVLCPHCNGFHGKPWGLERTLLVAVFLNALSFFFVLRPRRAFVALVLFALIGVVLVSLSIQKENSDALLIGSLSYVFLVPVCVNAVLLVRHQMKLDKPPPADAGGREV